jgi:hypothetical protein
MSFIIDAAKKQYGKVSKYFENQDRQQKLSVCTSFVGDGFRVVMASLLCIFIPQGCDNAVDNHSMFDSMFGSKYEHISGQLNGTTPTLTVCTFTENFTNLIDFNVFVLAFNFFTLGYFIYLYIIELNRENWMIKTLEYDESKHETAITTLKEEYPEVIEQLQKYNRKYMKAYKYLQFLYVFNFIFSAILVLYYYYYDYRTATTLLTNVALCSSKIRNGKEVAETSYKNEYAYSYFNIKHLNFNAIDPKYKKEDQLILETDLDKYNVKTNIQSIKKYMQTF